MIPNTFSEGRSRVFLVRGFEGFFEGGRFSHATFGKNMNMIAAGTGVINALHFNGDKKWFWILTILAFGDFSGEIDIPDFFWGWQLIVVQDLIKYEYVIASIWMMSITMMMTR